MHPFNTPSVTAVSGHTASKSASLVITCPACATNVASTAKGFGGSGTNCSSRHKLPVVRSSRNGGKLKDCGDGILTSSGPITLPRDRARPPLTKPRRALTTASHDARPCVVDRSHPASSLQLL